MYNSQYYTCEQIDQRLLQGYVDDFNSHTSQSLTKAQFLAKLAEVFSPTFLSDYFTKSEINNIFDVILTNGFIYGGVATPNGTPSLGGDSNDDYQSQLFFIATQPGTYTNYGGIVIPNHGFYIILWDTDTWSFESIASVILSSEMDEVLGSEVAVYLTDVDGNAVLDDNGKPIEII